MNILKRMVRISDIKIGENIAKSGPRKGELIKFAIITFKDMFGTATRITQNVEEALAYVGSYLPGYIIKADVLPYYAEIKQLNPDGSQKIGENGEPLVIKGTQNKRSVVVLEGETLAQACKLSGHTLSAHPNMPDATVSGTAVDMIMAEAGIPQAPTGDYRGEGNPRVTASPSNVQGANQQNRSVISPEVPQNASAEAPQIGENNPNV